ncbi:MAG: M81 family metallopeptidase, partial [Gemmatimonadales bacterium]
MLTPATIRVPARLGFVALLVSALTGCSASERSADSSHRPLRIAVGFFSHEATTFMPEKAGINDFPKPNLVGDSLLAYRSESIQGFVQLAREYQGVELIPLESPGGPPIGGSSKGWITEEAFEHYAKLMMDDLREALPVDGVYLSLHGAMAVEGVPRPEAELARRVRELVGPSVPIAGSFDPHGNEDEEFLKQANFSLVMKYFPHYDGRLQGERAARLLIRTARGDYQPTTATRKPGIITPTVMQWTGQYPWINLVQRALTWEARQKDVYVSLFFGFPWSDVPDAGATIQVMTNGNQALADEIAEDMASYMWRLRRDFVATTPVVAPARAVTEAIAATRSKRTPIVLADYSDRSGDATHILAEIVRQDLGGVLYATLRDERLLKTLVAEGAKAGDAFDREEGGFVVAPESVKPVR